MAGAFRLKRGVPGVSWVVICVFFAFGRAGAQEFALSLDEARALKARFERAATEWEGYANGILVQGRALTDEDHARIGHYREGAGAIREAAQLLADKIARGDVRLRGDEVRVFERARELVEGGPEHFSPPAKVPGRPPRVELRPPESAGVQGNPPRRKPTVARRPSDDVERERASIERLERRLRRREREVRLMQLRTRKAELELELLKTEIEILRLERQARGARRAREAGHDEHEQTEKRFEVIEGPEVAEYEPYWALSEVAVGPPAIWGAFHELLFKTAKGKGLEIQGPLIHTYEHVGREGDPWVTRIALVVADRPDLRPWATKALELRPFPAHKVLRMRVRGGHEQLFDAAEQLKRFAQRERIEVAGPLIARYFDDPVKTPPDRLEWEIALPVAE